MKELSCIAITALLLLSFANPAGAALAQTKETESVEGSPGACWFDFSLLFGPTNEERH